MVERWATIETFVPEDFCFLELSLRVPSSSNVNPNNAEITTQVNGNHGRAFIFTWKRTRLYDRIVTLALYESCLEAQNVVVTELTGLPKTSGDPFRWQQSSSKNARPDTCM